MTVKQREQVSQHLRALEALGVDVKDQWRQLSAKVEEYERGVPGEYDLRYKVPTEIPTILEHFDGKKPVTLAPHIMWPGYSYSLTPGQRRWFREFVGMTPSATVTVSWVETWPGTRHPRSFKIVSDVHVDPRHRAHVVNECVIRPAGGFFAKAQEFDDEADAERVGGEGDGEGKTGGRKPRGGKVAVPVKTLDELMVDLERGDL